MPFNPKSERETIKEGGGGRWEGKEEEHRYTPKDHRDQLV